jgi:glycosyltransferase involved in cell wall biosynthesis
MGLKIAFFGLVNSFEFKHIGGVDSIIRRLSLSLAKLGDHVDLVLYGAAQNESHHIQENIQQKLFQTFIAALGWLKGQYDHIVCVYLKPWDRIRFAHFRKEQDKCTIFHHFYFGWNESRLKRELLFSEAKFWPFNGYLFCISPRIHRYVSQWASRAELIFPAVPESYFCDFYDKSNNGKLRVTYAGRIDVGKGVIEAVEVCRQLTGRIDAETHICGFVWPHKQQTIQLHKKLLSDNNIVYEPVDYKYWTPQVDDNLMRLLRQSDILLLPYRKLSSTIDTPLLLLEAMANLCAVITPSLGDLHEIYGPSYFNLRDGWSTNAVVRLIENARGHLEAERHRLTQQNASLHFDTKSVVEKFRKFLYEIT